MSRDYEPIGYEVRPGQVEGDWQGVVLYASSEGRVNCYPSTTTVRRSRAAVEKAAKRIFEREHKDWEWRNQQPIRTVLKGDTK